MKPRPGIHALFVTDFDGTLYRGNGKIHREDMRSLHALGEAGVLRVIATGRSLESFRNTAGGFHLPVDYVLFSSGAGLVDWKTGTLERSQTLEARQVADILGVFEEFRLDYMIHEPIPDNHCFLYHLNSRGNEDFTRRCELYHEYCRPAPADYILDPRPATQLIAILPPGVNMLEKVRGRLKDFSVVRTTSPLDGHSTWVEVFPRGISKSSGIAHICSDFEIPRERVCAAGNDYNDIDLLEWAHWSFVPGSAPEELRTAFRPIPERNGSALSGAIDLWLTYLDGGISENG